MFKQEKLGVVREKTKILEMVLGTLLLVSGITAWHAQYSFAFLPFIVIKLVAMLAGTALAIISLKKENKGCPKCC